MSQELGVLTQEGRDDRSRRWVSRLADFAAGVATPHKATELDGHTRGAARRASLTRNEKR